MPFHRSNGKIFLCVMLELFSTDVLGDGIYNITMIAFILGYLHSHENYTINSF